MGREYERQVAVISTENIPRRTILSEDFEGVFKWYSFGTGTPTVEKNTTKAYRGNASLHIKTRTSTPAADDYAYAEILLGSTPDPILNLNLMVYIPSSVIPKYTTIILKVYESGSTSDDTYGVRYDGVNHKFQIQTDATTWENLEVVPDTFLENDPWMKYELEVDRKNKKYKSLIISHKRYDLSNYSPYKNTPPSDMESIVLDIEVQTKDTTPVECWIDEISITGKSF